MKVEVGLVKAEIPFELKLNVPLTGIHPGDPAYCHMLCRKKRKKKKHFSGESSGPGRDFFKVKLTPWLCWPLA